MLFAHEPKVLECAWESGIERIVIDWETRNKSARQRGYHLEQNYLNEANLLEARKVFPGELVCRINPINDRSAQEIDLAIGCGADVLILPMFKAVQDVDTFFNLVTGRAKTILLFETKQSVEIAKSFKAHRSEAYVGLNDLSISMQKKFAFHLLETDVVDRIRQCMPDSQFGFGAITLVDCGVPLETRFIRVTALSRNGDTI